MSRGGLNELKNLTQMSEEPAPKYSVEADIKTLINLVDERLTKPVAAVDEPATDTTEEVAITEEVASNESQD